MNIYDRLIEAIESLPEEPNLYVKVAMNHEMNKDIDTMEEIIKRFWRDVWRT